MRQMVCLKNGGPEFGASGALPHCSRMWSQSAYSAAGQEAHAAESLLDGHAGDSDGGAGR